jgi:hypothetical protein
MRRAPLAVLARLRSAEVMLARRDLAGEAAMRDAAEAREAEAEKALREEAQRGGPDYAAWLPRGLGQRDAAARESYQAARLAAEAAAVLAAARAAERAVEQLASARAADARREALREEQRRLDETGLRRAPRPVGGSA